MVQGRNGLWKIEPEEEQDCEEGKKIISWIEGGQKVAKEMTIAEKVLLKKRNNKFEVTGYRKLLNRNDETGGNLMEEKEPKKR